MFRSIRWRLVSSYVLLALVIVGAVGLLAQWAVRRYAYQQEIRSLRANAEAIARQAQPLLFPRIARNELAQLAKTAAFLGNVRVRILDTQHRTVVDSGPPEAGGEILWFMLPGEAPESLRDQALETWLLGLPPGRILESSQEALSLLEKLPPGTNVTLVRRYSGPWGDRFSFDITANWQEALRSENSPEGGRPRSELTVNTAVVEPGGRPVGFVELSAGTDYRTEALATTRQAFLLAGGAAVGLAALLGWWMGARLSAPIAKLTESATRMSAGDLSARARVTGRDETGRLAAQFNRMAGQLQASFDQLAAERDSLRRFIADASHELRTPITALKNFNELLQGAAAGDPQARGEFLAESQTQIERLEWITQNLLDLSRLDAGLVSLDLAAHNLAELLESAAIPFRKPAAEKGIDLTVHPPAPQASLVCDRARFEIALSNLLDNALKFTPAGGRIELGAEPVEKGLRVWVRDSGPGIHPDDLPHLFERFYRGRLSSGSHSGSGLGLAIVQSIVQAHGGRVWVESKTGEGASFMMEWPAR